MSQTSHRSGYPHCQMTRIAKIVNFSQLERFCQTAKLYRFSKFQMLGHKYAVRFGFRESSCLADLKPDLKIFATKKYVQFQMCRVRSGSHECAIGSIQNVCLVRKTKGQIRRDNHGGVSFRFLAIGAPPPLPGRGVPGRGVRTRRAGATGKRVSILPITASQRFTTLLLPS